MAVIKSVFTNLVENDRYFSTSFFFFLVFDGGMTDGSVILRHRAALLGM